MEGAQLIISLYEKPHHHGSKTPPPPPHPHSPSVPFPVLNPAAVLAFVQTPETAALVNHVGSVRQDQGRGLSMKTKGTAPWASASRSTRRVPGNKRGW